MLHLENVYQKMPMLLAHLNIGKQVQRGLETLIPFLPFAHIAFFCQDFGGGEKFSHFL